MNNIHMILAVTIDGVIGYREKGPNGRFLPWKKMSADMKRFAELTTGHIVVMGRKTWETLPVKYRPLPNRENRVLTKDSKYTISEPDVRVVNSVFDVLQYARLNPDKKIWIIGGAEIYKLFQKHCIEIHMTMVSCETDSNDKNLVHYLPDVRDFTAIPSPTVFADENNEFDSLYIVFRRKERVLEKNLDVVVGC